MARELPIFVLPVVLFPGAPLPLHIFEPRYRRLLSDCLSADRRFGVSYASEDRPAPGSIGCEAVIRATHVLPDGRANIIVSGEARYAVLKWLDRGTPYPLAEVRPVHDAPEDGPELARRSAEIRRRFAQFLELRRALVDDAAEAPPLAEQAEALTFQVCAALALDPSEQLRLLSLASTSARLDRLAPLLDAEMRHMAYRLVVRRGALTNGKSPAPPVLERR